MFYFHPYLGKMNPFRRIFFRWAETIKVGAPLPPPPVLTYVDGPTVGHFEPMPATSGEIQQKTSIGVLGWVVKGDPSCFQWFPKTLEGKLYPTREDFQVGEYS